MTDKNKKNAAKQAPQKKNTALIFTAAAAVIACAAVLIFANRSPETGTAAAAEPDEPLTIAAADITTEASFYPIEVDGTRMEIIAVRDSQGEIRTAFNTCQICYASGKGYYEQTDDYLVCQNCSSYFSMDQVGIESGGCNPWPISADDRTVTDDTVSISYDFLSASKDIFAVWKR